MTSGKTVVLDVEDDWEVFCWWLTTVWASLNDARWCTCVDQHSCGDGVSLSPRFCEYFDRGRLASSRQNCGLIEHSLISKSPF